jgi:CBS domain-containing membrane protein
LRELTLASGTVGSVISPAATAAAGFTAMGLLPVLTDGRSHAVIIVDDDKRILGLITQTDLLAATARLQAADRPSLGAIG